MKKVPFFLGAISVGIAISSYGGVCAQTVQLPSFQHFDASTTVWVPDGGSTNTAGITRSSSGGRSSGTPILPFTNRSYGSDVSTSNIQTSVQIIDLQEMDEQILNSPSPHRVRQPGERLRPEDSYARKQQALLEQSALMDVRDSVRARVQPKKMSNPAQVASGRDALNEDLVLAPEAVSPNTAKTADDSREKAPKEALSLAKKGYKAERAGDVSLAISYYNQASVLANGDLLRKIEKRRQALLEENP